MKNLRINLHLPLLWPGLFLTLSVSDINGQATANGTIRCPGDFVVNAHTGFIGQKRTDLYIPHRDMSLDFSFTYNSGKALRNIGYGRGWTFQYHIGYRIDTIGVRVIWGGGREDLFRLEDGDYISPPGVFAALEAISDSSFKLTQPHGMTYLFEDNMHKRVTKITGRNQNEILLTYQDTMITGVSDGHGRTITLQYTEGLLTALVDELGSPTRIVSYDYDGAGNLLSVSDPEGGVRTYDYFPNGPVNRFTDPNDNVINIVYNSNRTVKEIITCVGRKSFSFNRNDHSAFVVDYRDDGIQIVTKYRHDSSGNLTSVEGACCGHQRTIEYNSDNRITRLTDANGHVTTYTWDENGNMLSQTDALGNTSYYAYDPDYSLLTSYTDRNGHQTIYHYDANGNLITANFPEGITNSYIYNSNGDIISMTDGNGNTVNYTYDAYGFLSEAVLSFGVAYTFAFDSRGRITAFTDPRNNTYQFVHDGNNNLVQVADPEANSTHYVYDPANNLISITDRNGKITTLHYDGANRLVRMRNPLGNELITEYDALNNVVATTDRSGNRTTYQYDQLNRLTSIMFPTGEIAFNEYDNTGNVIRMTSPEGHNVYYSRDALGRMTQITDDIGEIAGFAYDNVGNVTVETFYNTLVRSFTYDGFHRLTSITDEHGNVQAMAFDFNSNITAVSDRNGNIITSAYDALDRLVSSTDELGNSTGFAYDEAGNLISVTDANGNVTSYFYDAIDRNTGVTYPDGTTEMITYDNMAHISTLEDRNGVITHYTYDDAYRLLSLSAPGNVRNYTYDPDGRIISAVNEHATVIIQSDGLGRMISETINGQTTSYTYHAADAAFTISYPGGRVVEYHYDERRRLKGIRENGQMLTEITYNNVNRVLSRSYPANEASSVYTWDGQGNQLSAQLLPANALHSIYGYDANSNRLSESKLHAVQRSELFDYDMANRLTYFGLGTIDNGEINTPLREQHLNYDNLGNRVTETTLQGTNHYTVNSVNAYTGITGAMNKTFNYDANGNLLSDGNYEFAYDSSNRLIGVSGDTTAAYKYDAFGRRIEKTVHGVSRKYYYSGFQEIEVRDGSDQVIETYINGYSIDDILISRIDSTDYFYYKDPLGSVIAVTDMTGQIVERYEYDPFGNVYYFTEDYTPLPASGIGNSFLYTGRYLDAETGQYHYRARSLNPLLGRFQQKDPLGYAASDMNLFTYVSNMPTVYTDPYGLERYRPPSECSSPVKAWNQRTAPESRYQKAVADYHEYLELHKDASLLEQLADAYLPITWIMYLMYELPTDGSLPIEYQVSEREFLAKSQLDRYAMMRREKQLGRKPTAEEIQQFKALEKDCRSSDSPPDDLINRRGRTSPNQRRRGPSVVNHIFNSLSEMIGGDAIFDTDPGPNNAVGVRG